MIVAYIDETGHPSDPRREAFGFGGFIGKVESWEQFDVDWRAVCPESVFPFHMKDFAQRRKGFAGWKEEDRRILLAKLLEVIKRNELVPIGVAISLSDFRSLSETRKQQIGDIYNFTLSHLFSQLAVSNLAATEWSIFDPVRIRLEVIFAESPHSSNIHQGWWRIKSGEDDGILSSVFSTLLISSVSVGRPQEQTPLQAADLWAYEIGHHFEYIVPNRREPRFPFQEIIKMPSVRGVGQPSFVFLSKEVLESDELIVL